MVTPPTLYSLGTEKSISVLSPPSLITSCAFTHVVNIERKKRIVLLKNQTRQEEIKDIKDIKL